MNRIVLFLIAWVVLPAAEPIAAARAIADGATGSWYTHRFVIDDDGHRYGLDCSGFAALALERADPAALAAVPLPARRSRRMAADFHAAFVAAPTISGGAGWIRVARLAEAKTGDLMTWTRPDWKPGETTGHVMFLDRDPEEIEPGRFRLRVLDCSSGPHRDDLRERGVGGIGRGTLIILADDAGAPVALASTDLRRPPRLLPFAIARWHPADAP